jgi:hypothetical protein
MGLLKVSVIVPPLPPSEPVPLNPREPLIGAALMFEAKLATSKRKTMPAGKRNFRGVIARSYGSLRRTAIEIARRRLTAKRLYWQTHETNLAARSLYDKVAERSGFIVYRKQLEK